MPLYDYVCAACGHRTEVMHGVHEHGPSQCPNCHAHALRKAIAAPAIVFKGSGWAKKDRGGSTRTKAAAASSSGDGDHGSSSGPGGSGADGSASSSGSSSGSDPSSGRSSSGGGSSGGSSGSAAADD